MTKTVKVRIAVAVDHNGGWSAYGGSGMSDEESMEEAVFNVGYIPTQFFVTAELPVPEQVEVEGEVEEVK
jgi:hypothetical protein